MSESQSRYSIVERLTQRKLDIMTAKSELKDKLKQKEQKIEEIRKDLANWSADIEEDIKRERRQKEREIENAQQEYENTSKVMSDRANSYDAKIDAIEDALKSIEDISRTSPTQ